MDRIKDFVMGRFKECTIKDEHKVGKAQESFQINILVQFLSRKILKIVSICPIVSVLIHLSPVVIATCVLFRKAKANLSIDL